MKCHNCDIASHLHGEHGCDNFQLDVVDKSKLFREVVAWLNESAAEGETVDPNVLLAYIKTMSETREFRKALNLKIQVTPHVIGEAVQAHFDAFPDHGYNCVHMDHLIGKWKNAVQMGKPRGETALRAFRYVLVTGERDY